MGLLITFEDWCTTEFLPDWFEVFLLKKLDYLLFPTAGEIPWAGAYGPLDPLTWLSY